MQTKQLQFLSIGSLLNLCFLFRSFSFPLLVNRVPRLAFWVGSLESKQSQPRAIASRISNGSPIPIRYRGLFSGNRVLWSFMIFCSSCLVSPRPKPPIEWPSKFRFMWFLIEIVLRSLYLPPWVIPKRSCLLDLGRFFCSLSCSFLHLVAQLLVLFTASLICSFECSYIGISSKVMATSLSMSSCIFMFCSGVMKIFSPLIGFRKFTPFRFDFM